MRRKRKEKDAAKIEKIGFLCSERIHELCEERNISPNQLAARAGMNYSSISNIFCYRSANPTIYTIMRLCHGLRIDLHDFFDERFDMYDH